MLFGNHHDSYHGDSSECNKLLCAMGQNYQRPFFRPGMTLL